MGDQTATGDALRSDLPGIAFRVPGTDTQVRLYGFAKLTGLARFRRRATRPTRRRRRPSR